MTRLNDEPLCLVEEPQNITIKDKAPWVAPLFDWMTPTCYQIDIEDVGSNSGPGADVGCRAS